MALKHDLAHTDWNNVLSNDNANEAYNIFLDVFKTIYDENLIKLKSNKRKTCKKPWMTIEIVRLIRKKHRLFKRYCQNRSEVSEQLYKNIRNMVSRSLHKARRSYYTQKFNENKTNLKNTWKKKKKTYLVISLKPYRHTW